MATPESLRQHYLTELPTPLARLYHRCFGQDIRARHENLVFLFEAAIKSAVMPAVFAYMTQRNREANPKLDAAVLRLERPSLGHWRDLLRELARYFDSPAAIGPIALCQTWNRLKSVRNDRPGTLNLYRRIKNGVDGTPGGDSGCNLLQLIDALVNYRNVIAHAGSDRATSFYEELVPLLTDGLNDLLHDLTLDLFGTAGGGMVRIREIRKTGAERLELRMQPLTGALPVDLVTAVELPAGEADGFEPDAVAVAWADQSVPLNLNPLAIYRGAESDGEVLFFNGLSGAGTPKYVSCDGGASHSDRGRKEAVDLILGSLRPDAAGNQRKSAPVTVSVDHSILPYLVNRDVQERMIQKVLASELDARPLRPVCFVISGDVNQCHDKFKSRLTAFTLRKLYRLGHEDQVDDAFVSFPTDVLDQAEFSEELSWRLADKFAQESHDTEQLALRLTEQAVVIYTELNTADWNAARERQITWFMKYWAEMPSRWRNPPPVICLAIKYVEGHGVWDRWRQKRRNERVRKWLVELGDQDSDELCLTVMPELPNVKRGDVDNWRLKFATELEQFPNADRMENELNHLFRKSHEYSMEQLVPEIRDLLRGKAA